ncbi:tRNA delta(2)-isopentenylpyrophosphate transferase [Gloeothece citriformis PCC 7424]|uniref:tRNA dimethylallyltransferase n=1 Tax=Gloeothece citriformis (strain PCC 7424) TaxID=65393 RepID=MIAA_GLOC7|nr:tRNA (adenosine(37)-N6)-dimethylallyltransferase MiaA [Gloeothece citriformis]B7KDM5.1 RecName: Full=tRNA dimethylallyltransferase; AltName: Full=Dimethylallyl diphosphate:tRNA dimethylallyltransferase; Short=DMAPP:tRNA dimethylallyltransferase; Short=DMATase; AltName: Full=Isopentenyl-diphosphate:tRNA isopentenyltransferase; Short=IPP transferase; Short=IPPT; Short=IPTase [Gloeothece citriformis PCC 7424]ACK70327.1 tRNA delta(2)-isopentenylpyrophosphate transferase [Gloeothece citriformis PCC
MKTPLIVICGPTASGKSGLAIDLSVRLNSIIISADSRQVYREFDIGTAKPSIDEQKLIPHYLIDICEPTESLTLAQYQEKAQLIIHSFSSVVSPILVGGTGLYLKSVVKGMKIPRVSPQPQLRSQLEALGQSYLYNLLSQVDPIASQKIHPHDQIRTIRALEVFYVTGKPISSQQGENPPDYPIIQIGLDCEVNALEKRIQQRTEQMIESGLVEEVEKLIDKYGENLPLLDTLGYAEMKQYLAGKISLSEAKELTVLHTRQFAKRQRTWFRAYPEIHWFDANAPHLLDQVTQLIRDNCSLIVSH